MKTNPFSDSQEGLSILRRIQTKEYTDRQKQWAGVLMIAVIVIGNIIAITRCTARAHKYGQC